jgi:hypothetical protein
MAIILQYTGQEALEMIKLYYPKDWDVKISNAKKAIIGLSKRHNITLQKAYRKFIIPVLGQGENILYFAALSDLVKIKSYSNEEKKVEILRLEAERIKVKNQSIALEKNEIMSYEDKKIIRGYYIQLQQTNTQKINELLNAFEVIEPKLIIHQPGLFDASNS